MRRVTQILLLAGAFLGAAVSSGENWGVMLLIGMFGAVVGGVVAGMVILAKLLLSAETAQAVQSSSRFEHWGPPAEEDEPEGASNDDRANAPWLHRDDESVA